MIKVLNLKEINKGSLKCRFDLEFENLGLTVRECTLMEGKHGKWVQMPTRPYEKDGQKKYYPLVSWDTEKRKKLEEEVIPQLNIADSATPETDDSGFDCPF